MFRLFYVVYLVPVGLDCISYVAKRVSTLKVVLRLCCCPQSGIMASKSKKPKPTSPPSRQYVEDTPTNRQECNTDIAPSRQYVEDTPTNRQKCKTDIAPSRQYVEDTPTNRQKCKNRHRPNSQDVEGTPTNRRKCKNRHHPSRQYVEDTPTNRQVCKSRPMSKTRLQTGKNIIPTYVEDTPTNRQKSVTPTNGQYASPTKLKSPKASVMYDG